MLEVDFADTCTEIFSLMSMGGRAEGLACADAGVRTPIGASGNFILCSSHKTQSAGKAQYVIHIEIFK